MTDQQGTLRHDILQRMLEVAQHLSASANVTDILAVIVNAMRDTLDAERATVFEYDPAANELFSTVAHGLGASGSTSVPPDATSDGPSATEEIRIPCDFGLAGQCAQERRIINVPDAYADDRFNPEIDKRTGFRTRSILTVPLLGYDGELIGVAQVLNKRGRGFDTEDEQIATALASHAAVAIKRGRLIEDRLVREKLERDLQLARSIQQSTFPMCLPALAGFDIDAWSEPAEETGGDAYDVIGYQAAGTAAPILGSAQDVDRAVLLLADATGHGIGPALSVTQVRAMLRMAVRIGAELPRIVRHLNNQLCDDLPSGRFVTAWLGELNATDHTLRSFSAGQGPLLRYDAARDTFDMVESDAMPFGIMRDLEVEIARPILMRPGDLFAVISDGIFEAMDRAGRQFGPERVVDVLSAHHRRSPQRIMAAIRDAVNAFTDARPAGDDRTAIVIKRTEQ
ncbi:MAG: SpoIIE family protein phosphatase [Planctomycetota bacterium]|nr:SpoIIE family protein phosphatase [Planctomycetota bacterium]